jgi:soluble lytic murein transglycosylase-like protein
VNKVNVYESYISSASQNHNIPEARIKAHIAVESDGNSNAIGSDGEIGLMQMTQDALNEVNNRFSPNAPLALSDLYQPNYSIEAGAAYLQILYEQLGDLNQASQAYNVGHDNINSSNGNLYLSKILAYEKLF